MYIQPSTYSSYSLFNKDPWIEIKNSLQVTPENARVYLQNGKQIKPSELDYYQINCEIEVRQVLDSVQTVFPGRYEINNISIDESSVVFMQNSKMQMAFLGNNLAMEIKKYWKFSLQSKKHPEVMNMFCRGVQDIPFNAQLPTVDEIKQAVGDNIEVFLISD
jgi:hypothetical protein